MIILVALPLWIIIFFFSKKILKKLIQGLDKIDTFDAFTKVKNDVISFCTRKFSRWEKRKNKKQSVDVSHYAEPIVSPTSIDDTIEKIIKPKDSVSKYSDTDILVDNEERRMTVMRKKKLLEKIIYDALGFRKDGKLDEYEKKIIEWLAIDQEDKELNKLLADLYFAMSNYKKSLPILKKIVDMDSKDHKAIWQIGEIYLSSGDFSIAELLIQKAIDINPSNPKYYISMVELLYNTERKHESIVELEKVVKLRPTNSAYMLTLADLYKEVGDFDNAKKYYFRVLEYEPSNEKAKKTLKDLVIE